ncbi:MAG: Holliday junction branch migration protein RuvA [Bacteroidales bacterium]|nr:Holliday junction branch migration protein RuvA [Bacteroidales bacterium]
MYNYFEGRLDELNPTYAVVDCGGVGYLMDITLTTYEKLKDHTRREGEKVRLYVHESIREDAHLLFGFYEQSEREMFRLLVGVNGVGPASARMILSSMNPSELQQAIANQDAKLVQRAKGIGTKTAQRIVLELQDKIDAAAVAVSAGAAATNMNLTEAATALEMLGFPKPNIAKALQKVGNEPGLSTEEIIKRALKVL